MKCEHGNRFAAWASPSGAIFHVCWGSGKWTLFPGAPVAGQNIGSVGDANQTGAAVGAGWLPLGW